MRQLDNVMAWLEKYDVEVFLVVVGTLIWWTYLGI